MDRRTMGKIISGVVGLALVGFGGYLVMRDEGEHGGVLLWAGLAVIGGGLGTSLLPSAVGAKKPPTEHLRTVGLAFLVAGTCAFAQACGGGGVGAAAGIALKTRDLTCTGGRVVCRITDRICRGSGGPWVVPRSDEEVLQDQRAGAFGEVTGSGSGSEDVDQESASDDGTAGGEAESESPTEGDADGSEPG